MKRSTTLVSIVANEYEARRELEGQLAFTFRKVQILEKHEAFKTDRAATAFSSASPAAEVESLRIQSFVKSSATKLQKLREQSLAAEQVKCKNGGQRIRKPSRYELEILKSRRHVAAFEASAELRVDESQRRALIDKEQCSLRLQMIRLYLKNLTRGLQSAKVATESQLGQPKQEQSV